MNAKAECGAVNAIGLALHNEPVVNVKMEEAKTTAEILQTLAVRVDESTKPALLSQNASPVEFANWVKDLQAYFKCNNLHRREIDTQHCYFYPLLDSYLKQHVRETDMQENMRVLPHENEPSLLESLRQIFLRKHPLAKRRIDLFRQNIRQCETLSAFVD